MNISVIIPLYNKEKSIAATLASVASQSYPSFEVVIVDDGSTDESPSVVEHFIAEHSKLTIQFIRKTNGGVSSARNAGVMAAKGEYVAFLDGDDYWAPSYLQELSMLINDYPNAGLWCVNYNLVKENGERVQSLYQYEDNFRGVLNPWEMSFIPWTGCCSARKDVLIRVGLFKENLTHGEDLDVWLRLMLQGDAVFYNKTLAYYQLDAENRAMHQMPPIEHHVVSAIPDYAQARAHNAAFRKAFDTQMIYFLYQYMFTPYRREAMRLAKMLDYSQLKFTMWLRMRCPWVYKYLKLLQ